MKDSIVDIPPALLVSCSNKSCIGVEEDGVTTTGGLLSDSVASPKNSHDSSAAMKNRRTTTNMSKLSRMSQTFSSLFTTKPTGEYVVSSSRCHSHRSDTRSQQSQSQSPEIHQSS